MPAKLAQLTSYHMSQAKRVEGRESQGTAAIAVEAEAAAAANAAPMPMADTTTETRQRRQRRRQGVEHFTPGQPTQGHGQGPNGAPSNGFIPYTHSWMFAGAFVQHRHHKCVWGKRACTKASCEWWDVKIIDHGGARDIRVRRYNLSSDQLKTERWDDQYVDVKSLRPN